MRTKRGLAPGLLLVVALAGCGANESGGVATAGGSASASAATGQVSDQEKAVKYAQCLRDHGIQVADPENGQLPSIEKGTAPDKDIKAAMDACKQYLPTRSTTPTTEQTEQLRRMAKCMREHGFPKFPDPDPDQGGIDVSGMDINSPAYKAAQQKCMNAPPPSPGASGGSGGGQGSNG